MDNKKYCWTHGACNYNSEECELTALEHRKQATFSNKMGGDEAFFKFVGEDKEK